jgi:hypothetical protein
VNNYAQTYTTAFAGYAGAGYAPAAYAGYAGAGYPYLG